MDVLGYTPNTSQVLAFTGTSAQSVAGSVTNALLVRLVASSDCFVQFGTNPTAAATTGMFLPAGSVEYFKFKPGWKVAALQSVGAGSLYITEISR